MTFIGFDGNGYQSFVAESDDLLNWGNMRLAMGFGKEGEFDFGGRVLGAFLYGNYDIKAPRTLKIGLITSKPLIKKPHDKIFRNSHDLDSARDSGP